MENQDNKNKFIKLEDIDPVTIRRGIAFHFTPQQNLENILETGLCSRIGENSSGALGRSTIPKVYFSYGLEGVLQLYNRFLNQSLEMRGKIFQKSSYKNFLPESALKKDPNSNLTVLEGFELVRQLMENNEYLIFDVTMSEYEHNLDDAELDKINKGVEVLKDENGESIPGKIRYLNRTIKQLANDRSADHREEIKKCVAERNRLAIGVYKKTSEVVKAKQGRILNEGETTIMDRIDFNDERLEWKNYEENPHNAHTRIIEFQEGKLSGISIRPENIYQFSVDGKTRGNGVQFLKRIHSLIRPSDKINLQDGACIDVSLIDQFYEYLELIEKCKSEHPELIVEKPERAVKLNDGSIVTYLATYAVDLEHASEYPEFRAFEDKIGEYYRIERKKADEIGERLARSEEVDSKESKSGISPNEKLAIDKKENQQIKSNIKAIPKVKSNTNIGNLTKNALKQGITIDDINNVLNNEDPDDPGNLENR